MSERNRQSSAQFAGDVININRREISEDEQQRIRRMFAEANQRRTTSHRITWLKRITIRILASCAVVLWAAMFWGAVIYLLGVRFE